VKEQNQYRYTRAVFSDCMETMRHFYPKKRLEIYNEQGLAMSYEGGAWQFEIGERIEFYENGRSGQDMPRSRGDLIFSCPKWEICEFEKKIPTEEEKELYLKLIQLNDDYLETGSKMTKTQYSNKKLEIKKEAQEAGISVDWQRFEMPHEWAKRLK
jgi:hypothetical protein